MTTTRSAGLRMLAVHAHPDDEASKGAAVMARYVDEGADVLVVTCTGGERGDVLNPALVDDPSIANNIVEVRRAEMAEAARILGVRHQWLGYEDSGYPDGLHEGNTDVVLPDGCFAQHPVRQPADDLMAIMREFRPHIITTYDENGGYPHPDHIMCHDASMCAFHNAGDPDYRPDLGDAWQPIKAYYNATFSKKRILALHQAVLDAGEESPFEWFLERWKNREDRPVHARIECAEHFVQRDDALRAHATQVDPDGFFFAVPLEVQKTIWPFEEYELGASYIDTADLEDDLFAGIRGTELVSVGGPLAAEHPVKRESPRTQGKAVPS